MKVNLAAKALSSSVTDAIKYCFDVLKLKQFQGSAATAQFICLFDRLFDILNSIIRVLNSASLPFLLITEKSGIHYFILPITTYECILTYQFSKDHLQLLFGAIRSTGRFNNNHNASQFTADYKCPLMRIRILGGIGNCLHLVLCDNYLDCTITSTRTPEKAKNTIEVITKGF